MPSPITRYRGCIGLWSVRCPGDSQLEGQSGQTTYLIEFTKIDGALTTVFTYLPFFFIHSPMISFQFDVFVSRYHHPPPLPTCDPSHEKRKKKNIAQNYISLSISLSSNKRVSISYPFKQAKINFNADPEITLPHSFTVVHREGQPFSPLVFLFPLIVHRPRCSTRRALSTDSSRRPLPNAP